MIKGIKIEANIKKKEKSNSQSQVIKQIIYDIENQFPCNSASCCRKEKQPCIKVLFKSYDYSLMDASIWGQLVKQN